MLNCLKQLILIDFCLYQDCRQNSIEFTGTRFEKFSQMSRLLGKPTTCICENKGADQLCGKRQADQRLCFRYTDSKYNPSTFSIQNFMLLAVCCLLLLCSPSTSSIQNFMLLAVFSYCAVPLLPQSKISCF